MCNKVLLSVSIPLMATTFLYAQRAKVDYRGQSKIIDISKIIPTGCILSTNNTTKYYEGKCVVEIKAVGRSTERFLLNDKERLYIKIFFPDDHKK
ncbi:hypothetical protein NV63_00450 [Elizabethkingia anophelis]|nr:hypothetical protein NV63_00450 [Elizabethkingia anophelis]